MMTFASQDDRPPLELDLFSVYPPENPEPGWYRHPRRLHTFAAAANRFPYTADISPESLVAFGSHKFVSLWNLPDENIHATLPGHEGVVTCLRFREANACFVSGDDKGVLRCWEKIWISGNTKRSHFELPDVNLPVSPFPSGLQTKDTSACEANILHDLLRRLPRHWLVGLNCKGLDCGSQRWCRHANRIFVATPVC
jgi:hypothetical protein